jgi:hypothetical protein
MGLQGDIVPGAFLAEEMVPTPHTSRPIVSSNGAKAALAHHHWPWWLELKHLRRHLSTDNEPVLRYQHIAFVCTVDGHSAAHVGELFVVCRRCLQRGLCKAVTIGGNGMDHLSGLLEALDRLVRQTSHVTPLLT